MLSPALIRSRKRKGIIKPVYASKEDSRLAKTIISVFLEHIDKNRGLLIDTLAECEELGYDFKLVRGFAFLLEEKCVFQTRAKVNPVEAREALFKEAGNLVISSEKSRVRVLSSVAFKLGISTLELEESLYADLANGQILTDFDVPEPLELVKGYNFALVAGLLAHAKRLEIAFKGRDPEIESLASKLGKSQTTVSRGLFTIVSEWKPTTRIGYKAMTIEAILSRLISSKNWILAADVFYPLKSKKPYRLEVNQSQDGAIIQPLLSILQGTLKSKTPVSEIITLPRDEVVVVSELARKMRLTEEEVKKLYSGKNLIDLGDVLMNSEIKTELQTTLEASHDMRLGQIKNLMRKFGVKTPVPVLEALGYDIEWNRIRDESIVYKLGKK
jgi:hypothetical protein